MSLTANATDTRPTSEYVDNLRDEIVSVLEITPGLAEAFIIAGLTTPKDVAYAPRNQLEEIIQSVPARSRGQTPLGRDMINTMCRRYRMWRSQQKTILDDGLALLAKVAEENACPQSGNSLDVAIRSRRGDDCFFMPSEGKPAPSDHTSASSYSFSQDDLPYPYDFSQPQLLEQADNTAQSKLSTDMTYTRYGDEISILSHCSSNTSFGSDDSDHKQLSQSLGLFRRSSSPQEEADFKSWTENTASYTDKDWSDLDNLLTGNTGENILSDQNCKP